MVPLLKPEVKSRPSFQHVFSKFHQHLLYFCELKIKSTDLGKQKHISLQAGAGKFGQTRLRLKKLYGLHPAKHTR